MGTGKVGAAAAAVAALALAVGACAPSGRASGAARRGPGLTVAATVAPVVDIVRQVVGDRVRLVGLIPEGVDSHTFEPSPETVKTLAHSDVLFMDGLHLERSTLEQARANMPTPVAPPPSTATTLASAAKRTGTSQTGD